MKILFLKLYLQIFRLLWKSQKWMLNLTRMHSSRMRTARPLTGVPICMLGGGPVQGVGVVQGGGGPVQGGWSCPWGGGGGMVDLWPPPPPCEHVTYPMMHLVSPPPPPRVKVTHACENITFATREVMMCLWCHYWLTILASTKVILKFS